MNSKTLNLKGKMTHEIEYDQMAAGTALVQEIGTHLLTGVSPLKRRFAEKKLAKAHDRFISMWNKYTDPSACPSMMVHGEADQIITVVLLSILADIGHFPPNNPCLKEGMLYVSNRIFDTKKAEINALVRQFLNEQETPMSPEDCVPW